MKDNCVIALGVIALVSALVANYGVEHWFPGETLHQAYLDLRGELKGELKSSLVKTEPAFQAPVSPIIDLMDLVKSLYVFAAVLGAIGLVAAIIVRVNGRKSLINRVGLAVNAAGLIIICLMPSPR